MTRKPLYNAILASGYIVLISTLLYFGPQFAGHIDSVLVPIAMLSLFVLSAATMGYLFLLQPVQLYLDGAKKEAVDLFARTVGIFAIITLGILGVLFLLPTLV